jgi:hypothetical protein
MSIISLLVGESNGENKDLPLLCIRIGFPISIGSPL